MTPHIHIIMSVDLIIKEYGGEYISSRTNPKTVMLSKLTDKKYRDSCRLFIAEGVKLTSEAICYAEPQYVVFSESFANGSAEARTIANDAAQKKIKLIVMSDSAFSKLSTEKAPQGVLSVVKYQKDVYESKDFSVWQKNKRIIMLDSVRDPGNVGTIIRTAEALGMNGVVLCGCADIYNNRTVRAAMGSIFRLPVYFAEDGQECVETMKRCGRRVFAASLGEHSLTLGKYEIREDDCFIVGNEGHGVSEALIKSSTGCVIIPMAGQVESLNAAAAAACIMWEYFR